MITRRLLIGFTAFVLCLVLFSPCSVRAEDQNWPREVTIDGNNVVVYQPQIDEWKDYTNLEARMVVEITPPGEKNPIVGAVFVSAKTDTDLDNRVVKLSKFKVTKTNFPALDEQSSAKMTELLEKSLPQKVREVSVDRILANLKRTKESDRKFKGDNKPPTILVGEKPSILVQFEGKPVLYPIEGTNLQFAVNTNWDLFVDTKEKQYYLLNGEYWLTAKNFEKGPWQAATTLPKDFSKIPDDGNWTDVRKHLTIKKEKASDVPKVFVTTKPAEMIVIDGKPELSSIEGTELSIVTNADNYLFFYKPDKSYYFLVSGRWFKTKNLKGTWSAVGKNLPKDFAKIPDDGSLEGVLASIPGTPQAEEALIQAAIPQKAVVKRKEAKLDVTYDGEPKYEPIKGTSMKYAVNSPNDVIQVGNRYYACVDGVWFVSDSPTGPWEVADSVPDQIYQMPSSSPVYRTSYVYVYDSDDDEVEFGYTSGYLDCYEEYGTVVYGTGYYYRPYWRPGLRPIFWPRPCSYGFAAHYNPFTGNFARAGWAYGPYRGIGRGAVYNPRTGTYARGGVAWGPRGAAWAGVAYNPSTGWVAGGGAVGRRPGVPPVSPYAGWGKAAAFAGAAGAVGALGSRNKLKALYNPARVQAGKDRLAGIKRPGGARDGKDRMTRPGGKGRNDLYVGKDGNIYKRSGKDKWEQYTKDRNWKQVKDRAERPGTDRGLKDRKGEQQRLKEQRAKQHDSRMTDATNKEHSNSNDSRMTDATNREHSNSN
jgi:hypothetical protein